MKRLFLLLGVAVVAAYVAFVAGLYIGLHPSGQDALDRVGWPVKLAKRAIFGIDPLLVTYKRISPTEAVFSFDPVPGFDGMTLTSPDLINVLPRNVSPAAGASSLSDLMLHARTRTLTGKLSSHSSAMTSHGYFRHIFDFEWTRPEFFSPESEIADCVTIIVPGTGYDEAAKIIERVGYHEKLIDQLPCQKLVYVKPNHDSRQIVYGGRRAEFEYIYSSMIAIGSSYSYWYLQELIETVMYLTSHGKRVVLAGLSQGGGASLLVGAVTDADVTVAISGYFDASKGMLSNSHQILIDGMLPFLTPAALSKRFHNRKLIMTYGEHDLPVYRHEAATGESCKAFAALVKNFQCVTHPGGHTYPQNLQAIVERALN